MHSDSYPLDLTAEGKLKSFKQIHKKKTLCDLTLVIKLFQSLFLWLN